MTAKMQKEEEKIPWEGPYFTNNCIRILALDACPRFYLVNERAILTAGK